VLSIWRRYLIFKMWAAIAVVLLAIMTALYFIQANEIEHNLETQLLEKASGMAKSLAAAIEDVTKQDIENGVKLPSGELAGNELKNRLFDPQPKVIPESEAAAETRKQNADYAQQMVSRYDGQSIPLWQYELKYTSRIDEYTDTRWQRLIDGFMTDETIAFALPIAYSANPELTGYIPTHNSLYSPTGEDSIDDWGSKGELSQKYRANRIFNDETGASAAAYSDRADVLVQEYPRVIDGKIVQMWDVGYPLYIQDKHWGAVRVALSIDKAMDTIAKQQRSILLGFAVLFVVVVILIFILMQLFVGRPLRRLTATASNLNSKEADLKFRLPVQGKDELARLSIEFNTFLGSLDKMISSIRQTSGQITAASKQLGGHADQSKSASESVFHAIEQVSADAATQQQSTAESQRAVEDMAAGIMRIADSATILADSAQTAASKVDEGDVRVQMSIQRNAGMIEALEASSAAARKLFERSEAIADILSFIREVAGRTNLLALNAAIEAARAGEHGRGFAVVSGEVRKLAVETASSVEKIGDLLDTIRSESEASVQALSRLDQEARSSTTALLESGESFRAISVTAEEVASRAQELSALAEELTAGTEEVAAALEQMTGLSAQFSGNASLVAKGAGNQTEIADKVRLEANNLDEHSDRLRNQLERFRVTE